ncbi:EAL domain-containing protein [Bacillus songklensis]|uniref:EAL domain-containing protein n=1 Tax=Bacillus songklensis TaxID=1069116 RepID=A0ABV8B2R6_9BACI
MSLQKKLSYIIALVVTTILVLNNALYYFFTESLLRKDQEEQMELLGKVTAIAIEHSQYSTEYAEDLVGENLRTAAVAAQYALDPDIAKVTDEQLKEVAEKIEVSYITLLQTVGNDIKGVKSSDPKERDMSTKDWGYWFVAFKQLFQEKHVTIPQGQKLPHYWSGPMNTSYTNPNYIDKWGYYHDGTTNYIINPYVRDNQIMHFQHKVGPEAIVKKALEKQNVILEITGFNPKTFGRPPIYTETNGQKYIDFEKQEIQFGNYSYQDKKKDIAAVNKAMKTGKSVSFETKVKSKKILKSFIPINDAKPYVIGVVSDYETIKGVLKKQLVNNIIISIIVLLLVMCISYFLAVYIVRPLHHILNKVSDIAKGNFGAQVDIDRKDELGLLSQQVNTMSRNLKCYTQELKKKNAEIEYQANHDFLTGLPNLRSFTRRFNRELAFSECKRKPIAVMFLDLDRFKLINDMFGHSVGDYLLKAVAQRILENATEHDVVSRVGGDEFVLLFSDCSHEAAIQKAQRILEELSAPFIFEGNELFVTPSIGVSFYPTDGEDAETLVKNADIAMYRAKEQGRNNFQLFTVEMNQSILKRVQMEKGLRKALEYNELMLCYQPQIDLQTGKLVGSEALVRWKHPEAGMISPAEFIPIAEETGLIVQMGQWILRKACEHNVLWQQAGYPPIRVSVNLSARQFQQKNLIENVTQIIEQTGLDPKYLELEITESIAMHNEEYVITKLNALKDIGINIAMDDFGTGYSSLSYLKKFPIDTLKIDRSFISDIKGMDSESAEICSTIIAMARNMKLKVIAEGVETTEQLNFLIRRRCNEAQGYLFSKPLTADEFHELYESIQETAAARIKD